MTTREYHTGFNKNEKVNLIIDGESYIGTIEYFFVVRDNAPEVQVSVVSGGLSFHRNLNEITKIKE